MRPAGPQLDMSTGPSETFGAVLRRYRVRAGLTQEALAENAGLSPNAISALERGVRRRPYPHTIRALANALDLQPDQYERLVHLREQGSLRSAGPALDHVASMVPALSDSQSDPPLQGRVPTMPDSLIGREAEYAEILRSLANPLCRLLTLAGPGGVGKTHLALQVATDLASRSPDSVIWVSLVSITGAQQVPISLLHALNLPVRATEPLADQVLRAFRDCEILLVLDNMEQVLGATRLVEALLDSAPAVTCLVTSRERLRSKSEWVIDLRGLALTKEETQQEDSHTAAVQLFEARARRAAHEFVVNASNQTAVTRICRLVDGLPLGIELAAAWVNVLSPAEFADEIEHNLEFLTSKDPNGPARHSSLQAVFDHSWNLLTVEERQVFARLAVFRGGCSRSAAEVVAGGTLPVLAALVDKSVLRFTPDTVGPTRFDLHELLRQYAFAKLQTYPQEDGRTRDRHCAYFAQRLCEWTEAYLSGGVNVAWWEVAADLDNIRTAWAWAVKRRDHQALAQMGPSMYVICEFQGFSEEGRAWFREASHALRASVSETEHNPELVWALGQILSLYGKASAHGGYFEHARDQLREGYELLRQRGDILARTGTLVGLGYSAFVLGSYAEARVWFTQSIGLSRAHGAAFFLAISESMLALVAQAEGAQDALTLARAGLEDGRALGHSHGLARGLWALSCILHATGSLADAQEAAQEALRLSAELQDPWVTGSATLQLGAIKLTLGDAASAQDLVQESVDIFTQLGEPWSLGRALVTRGWVAQVQGKHDEARAWFEQALNKARAAQLDPIACSAQYGLAYLVQEEAPAAALVFLAQVIDHQAAERTIRDRAIDLHQALVAAD